MKIFLKSICLFFLCSPFFANNSLEKTNLVAKAKNLSGTVNIFRDNTKQSISNNFDLRSYELIETEKQSSVIIESLEKTGIIASIAISPSSLVSININAFLGNQKAYIVVYKGSINLKTKELRNDSSVVVSSQNTYTVVKSNTDMKYVTYPFGKSLVISNSHSLPVYSFDNEYHTTSQNIAIEYDHNLRSIISGRNSINIYDNIWLSNKKQKKEELHRNILKEINNFNSFKRKFINAYEKILDYDITKAWLREKMQVRGSRIDIFLEKQKMQSLIYTFYRKSQLLNYHYNNLVEFYKIYDKMYLSEEHQEIVEQFYNDFEENENLINQISLSYDLLNLFLVRNSYKRLNYDLELLDKKSNNTNPY